MRAILLAVLFLLSSCGKHSNPANPEGSGQVIIIGCKVIVCGTWLGALDLSGMCRDNPPTPGALESTC